MEEKEMHGSFLEEGIWLIVKISKSRRYETRRDFDEG